MYIYINIVHVFVAAPLDSATQQNPLSHKHIHTLWTKKHLLTHLSIIVCNVRMSCKSSASISREIIKCKGALTLNLNVLMRLVSFSTTETRSDFFFCSLACSCFRCISSPLFQFPDSIERAHLSFRLPDFAHINKYTRTHTRIV